MTYDDDVMLMHFNLPHTFPTVNSHLLQYTMWSRFVGSAGLLTALALLHGGREAAAAVTMFEYSAVATFDEGETIAFDQTVTWEPYNSLVEVTVTLSDAFMRAHGAPATWHVHERATPTWWITSGALAKCGATGGHFTGDGGGACDAANRSAWRFCEAGDLSGKFGALAPGQGAPVVFSDASRAFTVDDVANRSVVLHSRATGERVACATIVAVEDEPDGAAEGDENEAWELAEAEERLLAGSLALVGVALVGAYVVEAALEVGRRPDVATSCGGDRTWRSRRQKKVSGCGDVVGRRPDVAK